MTKERRNKLVDFIVSKISDEADDYATYNTWAGQESGKEISTKMAEVGQKMKQIADDERKHRDCLIKMLAEIAKEDAASE